MGNEPRDSIGTFERDVLKLARLGNALTTAGRSRNDNLALIVSIGLSRDCFCTEAVEKTSQ